MLNDKVEERFAFLFLGQWTAGGFGEDRKDIAKLIKIFYETFANKKKQPALILKTNGATYSVMDKEDCLNKIRKVKSMFPEDIKLPNVYLLHGDFTDEEVNLLYNHPKIKAMVSFTHGEGFGRPLLEATMAGLPVIASGWSGHVDFLDKDKSLMLDGSFEKIPQSMVWDDILISESQWFNVDENLARRALDFTFKNVNNVKGKAKQLMHNNRKKFTLKSMTSKLGDIVNKYIKDIPTEVSLKLPKLKKLKKIKEEVI